MGTKHTTKKKLESVSIIWNGEVETGNVSRFRKILPVFDTRYQFS